MFVAEPGNVLITCDYSQLEPRVLADKCGDEKMIDLFVNGDGDTHTMTAEALYTVLEGKPVKIEKKDPRRQEGKILNLKLKI